MNREELEKAREEDRLVKTPQGYGYVCRVDSPRSSIMIGPRDINRLSKLVFVRNEDIHDC